jgi:large subunit ribosomal protein L21
MADYAIIETQGKQQRVVAGSTILVDRLDRRPGDAVELDQVLLVSRGGEVTLGQPLIDGARVVTTVLGDERGDKIIVFKYKPKVRYRRKQGHRQDYTRLAVNRILLGDETEN